MPTPTRAPVTPGRWLRYAVVALLAVLTAFVWYRVITDSAGDGPEVVVFLGDSYTQGVGASAPEARWTSIVSAEQAWVEVNLGRGGTGYATTAGPEGCGLPQCPAYPAMVEEAVAAEPDVVVVAGGQNDLEAYRADAGAVTEEVTRTYEELRLALPAAQIVAVGPSTPGEPGETVRALDAEVRRAAEAADATYVSLLEPPVLTEEMALPDGAHVGDPGHAAIAARVLDVLRAG